MTKMQYFGKSTHPIIKVYLFSKKPLHIYIHVFFCLDCKPQQISQHFVLLQKNTVGDLSLLHASSSVVGTYLFYRELDLLIGQQKNTSSFFLHIITVKQPARTNFSQLIRNKFLFIFIQHLNFLETIHSQINHQGQIYYHYNAMIYELALLFYQVLH